jgi:hypothetical protein
VYLVLKARSLPQSTSKKKQANKVYSKVCYTITHSNIVSSCPYYVKSCTKTTHCNDEDGSPK